MVTAIMRPCLQPFTGFSQPGYRLVTTFGSGGSSMLAPMVKSSNHNPGPRKEQQVPSSHDSSTAALRSSLSWSSLALVAAGCGSDSDSGSSSDLSGTVTIDGSSTVYPFAQAAAESFQGEQPERRRSRSASPAPVAASRSSAPARLDITDASRPIKAEEIDALREERHHVQGGPGRKRRHRSRRPTRTSQSSA